MPKPLAATSQKPPRRGSSAWLNAQYNNRDLVPECPQILQGWMASSAQFRKACGPRFLRAAYGAAATEGVDVFLPAALQTSAPDRPGQPQAQGAAPVLLFIHGGYWRSLSKEDFSFAAENYAAAGALVLVPAYALCPTVQVQDIAMQMARCLAWAHGAVAAWGGDARRIVVAGHSAGGHLAAMLAACDGRRLGAGLPQRLLHHAVSLSGLFDLAPIRRTPYLQVDLQLSAAAVPRLSPARYAPPEPGVQVSTFVGALESEEFRRQNRLLQAAWGHQRVPVCEEVPGCHHFCILDAWATPGHRLHALTKKALGL